MITPIVDLGDYEENHLYVKREDLLPFSFGGNKLRIAKEIFSDFSGGEYNCIIGYGSSKSNLCRVISNIAYAKQIPCYIVSANEKTIIKTTNEVMVTDCNAQIIHCTKDTVFDTVSNLIATLKVKGLKPYYIYGNANGIGNEKILAKAYINVFDEILKQENVLNKKFDYLFLPAGTGMTYSGLVVGKIKNNSSLNLVGISVARDSNKCYEVLNNYLNAFGLVQCFDKKLIDFSDKYLCGGYGIYNENISNVIKTSFINYGMPLDPTYTGKAFYGMSSYLKENNISGKNVLFLHTGGTPLFFDYYRR